MKKPILIAVVLLAAVAALLPPVLGSMTESQITNHVEHMNDNPMLAYTVDSYDKGWFSSTAIVRVGINPTYANVLSAIDPTDTNSDAAPWLIRIAEQSLPFRIDIAHGPIGTLNGPFLGVSKLVATPDPESELVQDIHNQLNIPYLMQLRGKVNLLGAFKFSADTPAIEFADESGELSITPLTVEGTARGQKLVAEGSIEQIEFDVVEGSATIRNLQIETDSKRVNQLLWIGDSSGTIESVQIADRLTGTGRSFTANDLRITVLSSLNDDGETIDGSVVYSAAEMLNPSDDFKLTGLELGFGGANLSVDALTRYLEISTDIQASDPIASMQELLGLGNTFMSHAPTISVSPVRFSYNDQPLDASVEIRTNAEAAKSGIDFSNPIGLLFAFEANANLTASKTLVSDLAAQTTESQLAATVDPLSLPPGQDIESMAQAQAQLILAGILGQGYLVDNGDTYSTDIEYAQGEIKVNGSPLPLSALLQ